MSHHSRSPSSHASRSLSSRWSRSPYSQALKPLSEYGSTSSSYQDCSNHPVQQVQIPITTLAPCPRSQDLFDSSVDPRGYPHKTSYPLVDSDLEDVTNHTPRLRRPIGDRSTSHASAYARLQTFNERRLNKSRINAQKTFMVLTVLDKEGQWWADFVPIIFRDLDNPLSQGILSGNVGLRWNDPEILSRPGCEKSSLASNAGIQVNDNGSMRRFGIALNARKLLLEDPNCALRRIVYAMDGEMMKVYVLLLSTVEETNCNHDALCQAWLEVNVAMNNVFIGAGISPPDEEQRHSHQQISKTLVKWQTPSGGRN